MDDEPQDKPAEPLTQPPSDGLQRLAGLAQEFQSLSSTLVEEWSRADDARTALAKVLAEREEQHAVARERLVELEARAADLQRAREDAAATHERLAAEAKEAGEKLAALERSHEEQRARAQEERAALEQSAAGERARVEELQARLQGLETQATTGSPERLAELEKKLAEAEQTVQAERTRADEAKARLEAQEQQAAKERETFAGERQALIAERNEARSGGEELPELRARLKALESERDELKEAHDRAGAEAAELKAAREKAAAEGEETRAARDKAAGEAEELRGLRDKAVREVDELKMQVEGQLRQADGERARWQEERAGIAAERYKALSESAQLRARVDELEAQAASGAGAAEAAAREQRLAALAEELATLKAERSVLQDKLDAAERLHTSGETERLALQDKLEAADQARLAAEADRDRAKAETSPLWGTIESLQRQISQERERFEGQGRAAAEAPPAELEALRRQLDEQVQAGAALTQRAEQAETDLRALKERSDALRQTLKGSLTALRRTPFVPPTLRVATSGLESEPRKPARGPRLLFLDRDPLSVEPLAQELEQHGAEVLVAHYADEVSFFLKTPEARGVNALIADVMAFRSDQDMLERYKGWRQDLAGAVLLVSYRTDNPVEAERARQVPSSLGAIQVARTIGREALLEMLGRKGGPKPPVHTPSGVFRLFKR